MDQKKKSSKQRLEEKHMKNYNRAQKRSRKKNREEEPLVPLKQEKNKTKADAGIVRVSDTTFNSLEQKQPKSKKKEKHIQAEESLPVNELKRVSNTETDNGSTLPDNPDKPGITSCDQEFDSSLDVRSSDKVFNIPCKKSLEKDSEAESMIPDQCQISLQHEKVTPPSLASAKIDSKSEEEIRETDSADTGIHNSEKQNGTSHEEEFDSGKASTLKNEGLNIPCNLTSEGDSEIESINPELGKTSLEYDMGANPTSTSSQMNDLEDFMKSETKTVDKDKNEVIETISGNTILDDSEKPKSKSCDEGFDSGQESQKEKYIQAEESQPVNELKRVSNTETDNGSTLPDNPDKPENTSCEKEFDSSVEVISSDKVFNIPCKTSTEKDSEEESMIPDQCQISLQHKKVTPPSLASVKIDSKGEEEIRETDSTDTGIHNSEKQNGTSDGEEFDSGKASILKNEGLNIPRNLTSEVDSEIESINLELGKTSLEYDIGANPTSTSSQMDDVEDLTNSETKTVDKDETEGFETISGNTFIDDSEKPKSKSCDEEFDSGQESLSENEELNISCQHSSEKQLEMESMKLEHDKEIKTTLTLVKVNDAEHSTKPENNVDDMDEEKMTFTDDNKAYLSDGSSSEEICGWEMIQVPEIHKENEINHSTDDVEEKDTFDVQIDYPTDDKLETSNNFKWVEEMNTLNWKKMEDSKAEEVERNTSIQNEDSKEISTETEFSNVSYWREPVAELDNDELIRQSVDHLSKPNNTKSVTKLEENGSMTNNPRDMENEIGTLNKTNSVHDKNDFPPKNPKETSERKNNSDVKKGKITDKIGSNNTYTQMYIEFIKDNLKAKVDTLEKQRTNKNTLVVPDQCIIESNTTEHTTHNVHDSKVTELQSADNNFSQTNYWKDPIPEIDFKDVIDLNTSEKYVMEPMVKNSENNETIGFAEDKILAGKHSFPIEDVWLNKAQCEDAEVEYYTKNNTTEDKIEQTKTSENLRELTDVSKKNKKAHIDEFEKGQEKKRKCAAERPAADFWVDKAKYDDAEEKYYKQISEVINKKKNNEKERKTLTLNSLKMTPNNNGGDFVKVIDEIVESKEQLHDVTGKKSVNGMIGKVSAVENENIKLKQILNSMSKQVVLLEKRVKLLEDKAKEEDTREIEERNSISSVTTDEGVDFVMEQNCQFYQDCLCKINSK